MWPLGIGLWFSLILGSVYENQQSHWFNDQWADRVLALLMMRQVTGL